MPVKSFSTFPRCEIKLVLPVSFYYFISSFTSTVFIVRLFNLLRQHFPFSISQPVTLAG